MSVRRLDYVPLRTRSPYSMLEGALKMKPLAARCADWRFPAVALTDTNNMCGALEFSDTFAGFGLQPIIGVTLSMDIGLPLQPGQIRRDPDGTLVLLAQTEKGYENLMALSSSAFLDVEPTDVPHVKASALAGRTEGVIALTGGPDGVLNRFIVDDRKAEAEKWLDNLRALFPNRLYVEIQRHHTEAEEKAEPVLIDFAYEKGLPLVATNEPYYLDPEMHKAHDALLAISEGSYVLEKNRRKVTGHHYLKSPEQMIELFADLPEAIENTLIIAQRCAYRSEKRKPILPNFGDGSLSEADILAQKAKDGLRQRLLEVENAATEEAYFERLDFELGIIANMGFPGYFLIVADFIQWAKEQGIPVGPGRGSGAGSVVAWALTITDLDPLRYGLLFERFLNPERVSMPDFDIDFCQERRGEVIDYVRRKYGDGQVAQIITFGTLQARAVVRDVGRVMQMPLGQVDRLAKLVPSNPANPVTLAQAINMEPALQEARKAEPAVRNLLDTALQLEGLYRNASTHAAGVVIGDRPLQQLVPLYRDPRSDVPATQFTMKWAEKAGLVKFDFLGLKTLTVIDRCMKYLAKQGKSFDLSKVSTNTKEAYAPLSEALSAGVFQLESSGMRDVLRKMAPSSIEELTALISLYRPGPMKNIPDYVDRKFGRQEITYPHPKLEPILKETYGIIIYQEQVMEIAKVLSGFTLGDADLLRRAMGKKDQAEMDRQKSKFIDGAVQRDVDGRLAGEIFELVNEFAGYGFNKSHAAAYAMISFQTAYLKALYPVEFIAAIMSLDIANVEKLAQFYQEGNRMGIEIVSPCVNQSMADFDVADGKVLYALGALKNVGVDAMRHVVSVREQGGPFKDLYDFAHRVDMRLVNKRAIENLARSGAFDCLEPNRATVMASASILQDIGTLAARERASSQVSLFGDSVKMEDPDLCYAPSWGSIEQLNNELSAVGFYLGGHPLDEHAKKGALDKCTQAIDIDEKYARSGKECKMNLAGVVLRKQERLSKRGKKFAFVALSDPTGEYEVLFTEKVLMPNRDYLTPGNLIQIKAKAEGGDGEVRLFAEGITPFNAKPPETKIVGLDIRLRNASIETLDALEKLLDQLKNAPYQNSGYIQITAPLDDKREASWKLHGAWGVDPKIQKAIKANQSVEIIKEIAA
ncbi:DNA polymerase III alpha subunit [Litorimonas taeanensis]|uniref:DNA polymerase III subunit alpha n=1 Tax=Litorimonas taeanensis TaxID=568099 RepID=A0A420WKU2_9PROT|nr:DNA polymerase III subunit alpha [Litorimonas taeanensis]RKQ71638.1 DNA polymerase III alpha subunit [Litorimonas taeanensis]